MYQQYHQKIHHLLICFQYHPLSLLNVEIDTIWKTILDITAISITLLESFYKVKNSQWWYFAWENLRRVFFCCCIFILSIFFIHISFAFWRHPSPFPGLSPGFYTDFILSTQTIAEWFATLSFSTIPICSYREHYGFWVGFFYTGIFYLTLLHWHF